jgi:hypothetical protein
MLIPGNVHCFSSHKFRVALVLVDLIHLGPISFAQKDIVHNWFIVKTLSKDFVQYRDSCAKLPWWACRAQDMKVKSESGS